MERVMRSVIPFLCAIAFIVGIWMILTSNTGVITGSADAAMLAGAIISVFSGICLVVCLCSFLNRK